MARRTVAATTLALAIALASSGAKAAGNRRAAAPDASAFQHVVSSALDASLQWNAGAGAAFSAVALHQTLVALSIGASGRTKAELESIRAPVTLRFPATDWGLSVLLGRAARASPETLQVLQRSLGLSPPRRTVAGTILERPLAGGAPCAVPPPRGDALLWLIVTACSSEHVSWQRPPSRNDAVTAVFHGSQHDTIVRYMHLRGTGRVATFGGCDAVDLPVNGAQRNVAVVLPRAVGEAALRACVRSLPALDAARYRTQAVDVRLPELRLHFLQDLAPVLRRTGLADVVDPVKADFTPLLGARPVSDKLFSAATQLVLDERGVREKSSVQFVAVELRVAISKPRALTVDRPFLLCITAGTPRATAFLAAVTQP